MSILIKGMEMPKGCAWCHFRKHGSINEFEFFCGLTYSRIAEMYDRTGWEDMRVAHCPLVEVPTPHGRLIDADAAIDDIHGEILECQMNGMKGTPPYTEDLRTMWQRLEDEELIPTIIEAEEE